MKIIDIKTEKISIGLKKPFITALRSLRSIDSIVVKVITDEYIGYGAAAETAVITGDINSSIIGAIDYIKTFLIGKDISSFEKLMEILNNCIVGNTSAKASIDMALYDLYGKLYKAPVYKLLGGYRDKLTTDITISLKSPDEMAIDSIQAVNQGFNALKVKVGNNSNLDIERLKAIRKAVGNTVSIKVDANQGWEAKEAVYVIKRMEQEDINIDLAEQPVTAEDIDGLKYVTDNVNIPVLADESVFSPMDAMNIINNRAADMINIKLMKTGGIYNALKIVSLAETVGMKCMIGSMMENIIGVTAAAHLGAAKANIIEVDLDVPLLCSENPIDGGIVYDKNNMILGIDSGLGFNDIF
ncbi:L-Ala-D/L-Glu epimerase [Vallitalea longa]|uniref:Dipeptide epimerase n=1 Tax=Vallitalea longa TaxID=2936439 RepID=A0A9W6DHT8_9FIRM|nr:dipeptide epimerase [Vallitalea longa]GKX31803.1 L-Ala-D/L-Glu epimerase [Vallitalea longa]